MIFMAMSINLYPVLPIRIAVQQLTMISVHLEKVLRIPDDMPNFLSLFGKFTGLAECFLSFLSAEQSSFTHVSNSLHRKQPLSGVQASEKTFHNNATVCKIIRLVTQTHVP